MHSADYAVASCLTVSPSHAGILSERLNILSDFFTVGHHSSFLYQKRYSNTSTEIPLTTASNAGVRKKRFSANIFSSVHYTVFFYISCTLGFKQLKEKAWKTRKELDRHHITRFEKHPHDLGSIATARCQQRRLASTCGPKCL